MKVSVGDSIRVANFVPPSSGFNIVILTGEVRSASSSKARPGSGIEFNALELSKHLQSRYDNQVSQRLPSLLVEDTARIHLSRFASFKLEQSLHTFWQDEAIHRRV